jgi:hypothetical protein
MIVRLFLGLFLTIGTPSLAWGDVTTRDLLATGDGLITHDSETGLDWLDLTETTSLSWDELYAGAGGWVSNGWRHATTAEVCELLQHAGFFPATCPGPASLPGAGAAMDEWIEKVGDTKSVISPSPTRETTGWFDLGSPTQVGMNVMAQSGADGFVHVDHPSHTTSEKYPVVGHHLVRSSDAVPSLDPRASTTLAIALAAVAIPFILFAARRATPA